MHSLLNWLFVFISGLGIGAVVSQVISNRFSKRKLVFETKLKKYSHLITALQNSVVDSTEASRQKVVSAQKQVELIANDEIISISEQFYVNNSDQFASIRDQLIGAMKKDLKNYFW